MTRGTEKTPRTEAAVGESASVVVIGGGVIGASVAYHLAVRGVRDVVVLDRAPRAGEGSTGRATGGFRVQFAAAIDVRLSLLARELLRRFADETGGDCGYVAAGYLWLAENEAELRGAARTRSPCSARTASTTRSRSIADAVAALNPALRRGGIAGGTYCPSDGFIRPLGMLDGYRRAAQRLGVRFVWDAERDRDAARARRPRARGAHGERRDRRRRTSSTLPGCGPRASPRSPASICR